MTAEELERELFGENYRGIGAMAPEESMKSTAQLEKFYTYNKKNEEFQQLLDQEYERLRGMEDARRPDTESLEFTWATSLFPENTRVNKPETVFAEPDKPAQETAAEPEPEAVPSDTIDFTVVREKARLQKLQEAEGTVPLCGGMGAVFLRIEKRGGTMIGVVKPAIFRLRGQCVQEGAECVQYVSTGEPPRKRQQRGQQSGHILLVIQF